MALSPLDERPIRLVVTDDLGRSRVTVFLRLLLAIPHLVWLSLWAIAVSFAIFALWLAVLIDGQVPKVLHDFTASFLRYATHVGAYLSLLANPYPGFRGAPGYPVDVVIAQPARQSRWTALVRLVLAIPALLLAGALSGNSDYGGVLGTVAVLGWFAALALGRMPRGLRDLGTYGLGYAVGTAAYVLLLTGRYPDARPTAVSPGQELPPHPVRLELREDGARSRVTVFFRPLLALPHYLWLSLWSTLVLLGALAGWAFTLVLGRLPDVLHRFFAAYVRYASHVTAFATVVGGPFPGFTGAAGAYPVGIEVDPAASQRRPVALFRAVLAIPAVLVWLALAGVLVVIALLGWFAALFTARMPRGLLELGAVSIRYQAQTFSYLLFVTGGYPYAAPAVTVSPAQEPHLAAGTAV